MKNRFFAASAVWVMLCGREASASSVIEFPDNGSEQFARGGAWIARATDPLAVHFNPAGLAGQRTALTLQGNVTIRQTCFTRVKAATDQTADPLATAPGAVYPRVCGDGSPFPNPQIAFALRLTDRIGLGFAILGPSAAGRLKWPEFIDSATGPQAAPQRYILLEQESLLVSPTLGVGAEVIDRLRVGISLGWGIATIRSSNASLSVNQNNIQPSIGDIKAEVSAKDLFVPQVNLGALWSASRTVDLAGWFRWSAPIEGEAGITTRTNYFDPAVARGDLRRVREGTPGSGTMRVAVPLEAKVGVRLHIPRKGPEVLANGEVPVLRRGRDPLRDDVFDVELNVTWAHNSDLEAIRVRFPQNADGFGTLPVVGSGGTVPPVADVPLEYRDVLGVRLGSDWNVVPERLALRAGAFYETHGQNSRYQNLAFMGGSRLGLTLGAMFRMIERLDLMAGFGHIFVGDLSNNDPNAEGLRALAGSPCNTPGVDAPAGPTCSDGQLKYRTIWPVNLGVIANAVSVFNLGAAYRFQ